jgi:hypothetical protein
MFRCKTPSSGSTLKPDYINIKVNGNKSQDKKTTTNAIKYRINQELKFLYCKKQNLKKLS